MAVTANQTVKRQEGCRGSGPVAAAIAIYEGTLVFSTVLGYITNVIASGVNAFEGIAVKAADNSSGAAGDKKAEFWKDGVFELTGSGFSQATVGVPIYATDNYTVTTSGEAAVYIGQCVGYVSSTKILVRIVTGPRKVQSVTPAADSNAASQIQPGVEFVNLTANTTNTDDFFELPPIASVPIGFQIRIAAGAANCEMRTPAASGTKINDVDSDGTQEYLVTATHLVVVTKRATDNWVATSYTKLGAVVTAVVPD